jgi:quinohemoprotein ethanol dehydrogenase
MQCSYCHGADAVSAGMAPDLRASPVPLDSANFQSIVKEGAKVGQGMPAFPDLTDEQLSSLMHYIRQMAHQTQEPLEEESSPANVSN